MPLALAPYSCPPPAPLCRHRLPLAYLAAIVYTLPKWMGEAMRGFQPSVRCENAVMPLSTPLVTPDTPQEHLASSVECITFHSEETGFCVLRVKVRGHRDLIAVVGTTPNITPGEYSESAGCWVTDRTHGLQFKSTQLCVVPQDLRL
jgi:hypothetical protein